jgi:hypothetical protein
LGRIDLRGVAMIVTGVSRAGEVAANINCDKLLVDKLSISPVFGIAVFL